MESESSFPFSQNFPSAPNSEPVHRSPQPRNLCIEHLFQLILPYFTHLRLPLSLVFA